MVFNVPRIEIVPDLGSTPARVNRRTGTVYISKRVFEPLSERERNFVLAHEEGHYRLNTCDETKADEYAFKKYAGTEPFSLKNTLKILRDTLDTENNPGHRRRLIQLQKAVLKYDAKVYGNKKAQALLDELETENFDGKMAQENISEIIRNLQVDYLKQLGINDVNALTQEQKTGLLYSFMKTPQMQYVLKKKTDNAVTEYCGYADDPDFLEAYEAYSNEFCNFGKKKAKKAEKKKAKAEKKAAKKAAKKRKKLEKKIAKAEKKGKTAKVEKLQQKLEKKLDKIEKKKEKKIENADKTFFQKVGNVAKNVAKVSAKITKIATKVAAPVVSAAATAFGMPGVGNVVAKIAEKANPFELINNLKNKKKTAVVTANDEGTTVVATQNTVSMSKKDKKAAKKAAKAEKKAAKKAAKQAKKEAKKEAKSANGGGIIKKAVSSAKTFIANQVENLKEAADDLITNQNPITPEEIETGEANPEVMNAATAGTGAGAGAGAGSGNGSGAGAGAGAGAEGNNADNKPAEKTPIYKQWWFWVIIAVVVGGGIFFATSKKN